MSPPIVHRLIITLCLSMGSLSWGMTPQPTHSLTLPALPPIAPLSQAPKAEPAEQPDVREFSNAGEVYVVGMYEDQAVLFDHEVNLVIGVRAKTQFTVSYWADPATPEQFFPRAAQAILVPRTVGGKLYVLHRLADPDGEFRTVFVTRNGLLLWAVVQEPEKP